MPAIAFASIAAAILILAGPIFLAILAATFVSFELFAPPIPSMVLPQRMVDGINQFSLIAIPLFIFAADVISRGQIGRRLVEMAEAFFGHVDRGVAHRHRLRLRHVSGDVGDRPRGRGLDRADRLPSLIRLGLYPAAFCGRLDPARLDARMLDPHQAWR